MSELGNALGGRNTPRTWAEQLEDGSSINGPFCKTPITSTEKQIVTHEADKISHTDTIANNIVKRTRILLWERSSAVTCNVKGINCNMSELLNELKNNKTGILITTEKKKGRETD